MNIFTAAGINAAAAQGQRVVVATPGQREAGEALRTLEETATMPDKITRAAGAQLITYPCGGEVRILTRSNARGYSADTVYLDWEGANRDQQAIDELSPILATSRHGQMVTR